MKIHLNEAEIHMGIKMYIEHRGFSLKNQKVTIDMTQGRNPMRIYADVDIDDLDAETSDAVDETIEARETETKEEESSNNLFGQDDD